MSETAIAEAIDQAIEQTAKTDGIEMIAPDERAHLLTLSEREQVAITMLRASKENQDAQAAAGARHGFMFYLSGKYSLTNRDGIDVSGAIVRAPAEGASNG